MNPVFCSGGSLSKKFIIDGHDRVRCQGLFPRLRHAVDLFESNQKMKSSGALGQDIDLYGVCGGCVRTDFISVENGLGRDAERRFSPQGTPWIPRYN
jgi:hypothetical protein